MITTTKEAATALQSADDKACNLPSPGSRDRGDGVYINVCGDCGAPVLGPATRYRCSKCGKTADQYKPACTHIHEPVIDPVKGTATYPATVEALKAIDAAKAKADKDRTEVEKALAVATVAAAQAPKEPIK